MLLDRGSIEVTVGVSVSLVVLTGVVLAGVVLARVTLETATQSPVHSELLPLSARTVPVATATSHWPRSTRMTRPGSVSGELTSSASNVSESVAFQPYSVSNVLFSGMVKVSSSTKNREY